MLPGSALASPARGTARRPRPVREMPIARTRRQVLRSLAAGALAASPLGRLTAIPADSPSSVSDGALPATEADAAAGASPRAFVYRARREGILGSGGRPDPALLSAALGGVVARAAGEESPVEGLRRLFRPSDVVGIKVNCIAGKGLSSHPDLVLLLAGWLQEAGLPARNILIWDRTDRELRGAGYAINRSASGLRVFGTEKDYESRPRTWASGQSHFARFLVEDLTALLNVGVIKDHNLAGAAPGLKNWYGAIDSPHRFHDNGCHPHVARLAAHPLISQKLRLTVLDGLTAQCHGGPMRDPSWTWRYEGILASTDPVAADAVGVRIIEERRAQQGLRPLGKENRPPLAIAEAGRLGLGQAEPARIIVEDV